MNSNMKIVALGDSIIKGVLFSHETNGLGHYSLSDHNIVDRIADHLHVQPLNFGKMGCTVEAGERILDRHLSQLEDAAYVLLCYGGNDSDYNWRAIANAPTDEHLPKTTLPIFEQTYLRIIQKVREKGLTPIVMSLPPMDAQHYFDFFTSTFTDIQRANVLRWLKGSVSTIWSGHELYNNAVKQIAQTTHSTLIDLSADMQDAQGFLCPDGIHPNTAGQSKIANIIIKNIL